MSDTFWIVVAVLLFYSELKRVFNWLWWLVGTYIPGAYDWLRYRV